MTKAAKIKEPSAKGKPPTETPLMRQYNKIKSKYPDAVLLFRVGDFYETFSSDAITTAKVLGIILTKRANGKASHIELAGFPHHALDTYLPKLVRAGYRVAICDQLEDPKLTTKIVKRGVTELITPGVALNDQILDHKSNNFLGAVYFDKSSKAKNTTMIGIAFVDISTGEFLTAEGNSEYIDKLLQGFAPSEIIVQKSRKKEFIQTFGSQYYSYPLEDWVFSDDYTREKLLDHFETKSLKGYGIEDIYCGVIAAGACIHYLAETEHPNIQHINSISRIEKDKHVWLDRFTVRNLELIHSPFNDGKTLLSVLDQTISPMGARLLKRWLMLPLKEKPPIESRLQIVSHFIKGPDLSKIVLHNLKLVGDIERLISKVPLGKIGPREVGQLERSLTAIEPIKEACLKSSNKDLVKIGKQLNPCKRVKDRIKKEIKEDPPVQSNKGGIFNEGISKELDELREITSTGKGFVAKLQEKESLSTGIPSLKVGFNNIFGYYLEVTNSHKDKVPAEWIRKQTLVNAERYITNELKEYEEKITGAEEKIILLESALFNELVLSLHDYIEPFQLNGALLAQLDCLLTFASLATKNNYKRPELNDGLAIDIKEGRHPVIEQFLDVGDQYIPNDVYLDTEDQQIIIITGPNMSGKSALLRQTALITLMAQIGSFVPAASAKIGIVDKIFTRVGASDNIASGESTFMVEMNETASILNNISERSLLLLDEIGRGTSTYDGISIAWSISEFLHNHPTARPKTLFATHYHELNELTNKFSRIKNYNISIKEAGNKVLFMRKMVPGGSKHSFGIHVAKMAGMPKTLLKRANEVLAQLEQKSIGVDNISDKIESLPTNDYQLNIFNMDDPKYQKVKALMDELDVNALTPIEALMKLNEIKELFDQ